MGRHDTSAKIVDFAALRGRRSLVESLARLDSALAEQRQRVAGFKATMRQLDCQMAQLEETWLALGQAAGTVDVAPLRAHCLALGR